MNKQKCLFFSFLFLGLIVALGVSAVCATDPVSMNESVTLDKYGEIVPIEETEKIENKETPIKEENKNDNYENVTENEINQSPIKKENRDYDELLNAEHELSKGEQEGTLKIPKWLINPTKGVINEPDDIEAEIEYEVDHAPEWLKPFVRPILKGVARPMIWFVNYASKLVMLNGLLGNPAGVTEVVSYNDVAYADGVSYLGPADNKLGTAVLKPPKEEDLLFDESLSSSSDSMTPFSEHSSETALNSRNKIPGMSEKSGLNYGKKSLQYDGLDPNKQLFDVKKFEREFTHALEEQAPELMKQPEVNVKTDSGGCIDTLKNVKVFNDKYHQKFRIKKINILPDYKRKMISDIKNGQSMSYFDGTDGIIQLNWVKPDPLNG